MNKCFWLGHKWTRWKSSQKRMIHFSTNKEFVITYQQRICIRCNKQQIEEL